MFKTGLLLTYPIAIRTQVTQELHCQQICVTTWSTEIFGSRKGNYGEIYSTHVSIVPW